MTVNYTTNLALGQPVTGTESGTWGDDVNNAVTSYLDIAIAGGLAITVTTADVTLTITQGTSSATNIGSTTAQYAILNVSGAMTAARNLIVPSSSRIYLINNNTTGGFALTVKGAATTGVTLVNGEKAHVFWNGSDYAKLSNAQGGAGTFSSITNTGLTATRVVFSTTNGLETDSANLTFSGTILTSTGFAGPLNGTVGATTPAAGAFTTLSATGVTTVQAGSAAAPAITTSGDTNTGIWFPAADTIAFTEGGAESMRIDSSGNVGIGVSTVATNFRTQFLGTAGSNTSAASSGTTQAASAVLRLQAGGGFTGTLDIGQGGGTGSWLQSTDTGNLATTYPLLLNPVGGNVGIGTNAPGTKLQVVGIIKSGATGTNGEFNLARTSDGLSVGKITLTESTSILDYNNLLGAGLHTFTINAVERMRIDSSGNVGIGTNAPAVKLDTFGGYMRLRSNTTINADISGNVNALVFESSGGTGEHAVIAGGNASNNFLSFYTANSAAPTERMRIDSSGNVGIGTSSPQRKLHSYGGVSDNCILATSLAGNAFIGFADVGTTDQTGLSVRIGSSGNGLVFQTGGTTTRMVINSSGDVLVTGTGTGSLGYGTGSGGTVTQATDKSTAVTLNKPTGQITMNNAALLPATSVIFLLNNSLLAATDSFIVQPNYGANSQSYTAQVTFSGAGGAYIRVTNISAGSLSEAVTLSFAIIKGATS